MQLEPPQEAPGGFWDGRRRRGAEGAAPGRSRNSGRLRMEQPEHSARSIYGETLGTTSQEPEEASPMEASRSSPGEAAPNTGNIPALGITWASHRAFRESRGEQRLPNPLLPSPAVPCIPPWHRWALLTRIRPSRTRTRALVGPSRVQHQGYGQGLQQEHKRPLRFAS